MEKTYIDCNIRIRHEEEVYSFTLGFKYLPKVGDYFQYDTMTYEVINIQHHQVVENEVEVNPNAEVTLYVENVTSKKDLYER